MDGILSYFTSVSIFSSLLFDNEEWYDVSINIKLMLVRLFNNQNYSGLILYNLEFKHIEFRNANFDGCSLFNCSFSKCNINSSSFYKTTIIDIVFKLCFIIDTSFHKSKIINIRCRETVLRRCDFIDTSIIGGNINDFIISCHFNYVLIEHIRFDIVEINNSTFNNALIDNCAFESCELNNVSFDSSNVLKCNFSSSYGDEVDLNYVTFTQTSLDGTSFIGTNLTSCKMDYIKGAIFHYSDYLQKR